MHSPLQSPCFMAAGEAFQEFVDSEQHDVLPHVYMSFMCSCLTILKPESLHTRGQSELKDNTVGCRLDLRQKFQLLYTG